MAKLKYIIKMFTLLHDSYFIYLYLTLHKNVTFKLIREIRSVYSVSTFGRYEHEQSGK